MKQTKSRWGTSHRTQSRQGFSSRSSPHTSAHLFQSVTSETVSATLGGFFMTERVMRTILSCRRSLMWPQLRDHAVTDTVFHNHVHHSIKQLSLLRGKPPTTCWGRTTGWIKTLKLFVGATAGLILSSCFCISHARLNYTHVDDMPVVDTVIKSTWMKTWIIS